MYSIKNEHYTSTETSKYYVELRPIAIIGKIFGLFPFDNALKENAYHLRYNFRSFNVVYGILFQIICFVINLLVKDNRWLLFVNFVFKVRVFIVLFTCLYYERYLLGIIRSIQDYDEEFCKLFFRNLSSRKWHGLTWATYLAILIFTKAGSCFYFYGDEEVFSIQTIGSLCGIVAIFTRTAYIHTYMFLCFSVASRFLDLLEQWRHLMKQYQSYQPVYCIRKLRLELLEDIRLLHGHLVAIVRKINICYGVRLVSFFAFLFMEILHDLYIFTILHDRRNLCQAIFNCLNVADIILMGTVTTYLANSVSMHFITFFL